METVTGILNAIYATFVEMAPYLLLGLTFAGLLHILFKQEFVARHLGGGGLAAVVKAAVLGVPLPLCSCGVVPTALSLRKSKASDGATVSFLISTPQTGVDSIVATYGLLGPVFAVFRPLAAFVMGIVGGAITTLLGGATAQQMSGRRSRKGAPACVICFENGEHAHTVREKVVGMCKYAFGEFLDDISPQLVVGIAISGLISFFVPPDFFGRYVDNEFAAMALMIVGGIPLYVCATASIPIAAALMMKGLSPGAAFVFLAVGPATNAATVTLIASVMGKKIVAVYLSVISVLSVAAGLALNGVFALLGPNVEPARQVHPHHEMGPGPFALVIAGLFAILLGLSLSRRLFPRLRTLASPQQRAAERSATGFPVDGMTCSKCAAHVREAILAVPGVESCRVHLAEKKALVTGTFAPDRVRKAIQDAGYRPAPVRNTR
jgi:uncharacterized membrane protein YraQ (UPF0718 family)/copper chaperone CopZ